MSENPLVPQDLVSGPLAQSFESVIAGADYLPRFQLFSSKSDACAEGKISGGHYGLVKDDDITDLGTEVNILLVTWRAKAVQTGGEALVINYDIGSDVFADIKVRSGEKDSGCMYGPEFLIWLPDQATFATYHMNSKTSRREAKKLGPLVGGAATLKCRLIETPRYKWHGPVVLPCSSPITPPTEDSVRAEWAKFHNPPEIAKVELAKDEEGKRAR